MSLEKRAHVRISALVNAQLLEPSGDGEHAVRDLSAGGAFVQTRAAFAPLGGRVKLKLALAAGVRPIAITAEVARHALQPDAPNPAQSGVGLRFTYDDGAEPPVVIDLMDRAMLGPGSDKRAWPRVSLRLPVVCQHRGELRGVLRDLSEGGAGLETPKPLLVNEAVRLELQRGGLPALKLDGWVCSADGQPSAEGRYRSGMRFSRLEPQVRQQLLDFLKQQYRAAQVQVAASATAAPGPSPRA